MGFSLENQVLGDKSIFKRNNPDAGKKPSPVIKKTHSRLTRIFFLLVKRSLEKRLSYYLSKNSKKSKK